MAPEARDAAEERPRKRFKAYLLLGLAAGTCPCHLPLLLALLAGTALAGVLREHVWVAFAALAVVFVVSLIAGLRAWRQLENLGPSRPNLKP